MDSCAFPVGISAVACAIAAEIKDINELELLAVIFTQLGDTLATIAVQRGLCG